MNPHRAEMAPFHASTHRTNPQDGLCVECRKIAEAYDHEKEMPELCKKGQFAAWHQPEKGFINGFMVKPSIA